MAELIVETGPTRPRNDALADTLTKLYSVEAGLIQQKASHVLTIRSLAIATFTGVVAGIAVYPGRDIQLLSFVLLPFYLLDFVYDAYLIPIVQRESELRRSLAVQLDLQGADAALVTSYRGGVSHRVTPAAWNPFIRAGLEPVRILFYAGLIIIPQVVVAIAPHP